VSVSKREWVVVLGTFLVLSIALTWPVVLNLRTHIPMCGQPADPQHILYGLTSGTQALLSNPLQFFNATFFYPYPHSLSFLDQIVALCAMAAPIYLISQDMILSYNVVWLLTFMLSALGAFLLVRHLTGSTIAGLFAGILYCFHPFRYHNAGILHVVGMMWIPFALLMMHLWVATRKRRYVYLCLAFSLAQFLSSGYTGTFLILAWLLYFLVRFITHREETVSLLRDQRWTIIGATLLGALILAPLIAPSIHNAQNDLGVTERSLGASSLFSAIPADYLTPAPQSLLGRLLPLDTGARHPLFPGLVALGFAITWLIRRSWRDHPKRPEMIFYALMILVGVVFSLGPFITVFGFRIPMPFAVAYYALPGAAFIRSPVRFVILASIGIMVAAGAGMARWLGVAVPRRPSWAGGLICAVACLELVAVPVAMVNPLPTGVPRPYDHLRSTEAPLVIADLPMPIDERSETVDHARYQLYSLSHGKRLVNGVAAFVPPITRSLRRQVQGFPDEASVLALREAGVSVIFVHTLLYSEDSMATIRERVLAHADLELVEEAGTILVIEIRNRADS
jgi:hypothetical protein